jgi:hypothetical protein
MPDSWEPTIDPRGSSSIDLFLQEYVGKHPGLRFGPLVRAARQACGVSQRTAAWHLARLVTYGDLVLLSNRTYVVRGAAPSPPRPVVEVRNYEGMVSMPVDGTSQEFTVKEFRVVSGELDRLEWPVPELARQFVWWGSMPNRLTLNENVRVPTRMRAHVVRFTPPLSSKDPIWHRYQIYGETARYARMAHERQAGPQGEAGEEFTQTEWIGLPRQRELFSYRWAPDAHMRLVVVLPHGYPIGVVRCRVRSLSDPSRSDHDEEARLVELGREEHGQEGFRRSRTVLSVSVPEPQLDLSYELEWRLPTTAQRRRWIAAQHW